MEDITYPPFEFSFNDVINNYSEETTHTNTSNNLTTGLTSVKSLDVVIYLSAGRLVGRKSGLNSNGMFKQNDIMTS